MQIGDKIYVTGKRVDMALFLITSSQKVSKNFLLIGAGRISYYLLNILKNNRIKVKLIEQKWTVHKPLVKSSLKFLLSR